MPFTKGTVYRMLKDPALYQGTTLVVPQLLQITMGFSPCEDPVLKGAAFRPYI